MRAMILAAGFGKRMRPLTEKIPKPLLKIKNIALIEYNIYALAAVGIKEIVINVSYLGAQIQKFLGSGSRFGVDIYYSVEASLLETGGGIVKALPQLGKEPFMVISADIITDFPLGTLSIPPQKLAHIVLVKNPPFLPSGDFCLKGDKVFLPPGETFTYANIGMYRPECFQGCPLRAWRLGDLLRTLIEKDLVSGQFYNGFWYNLGTPEDLNECLQDARLNQLANRLIPTPHSFFG